jgi:hypothetical protein
MPRRDHVVNKLREIGFSYKDTTDRCLVYKRGTLRLYMPRRNDIDETWVRQALRQAGVPPDQIDAFLRMCKA